MFKIIPFLLQFFQSFFILLSSFIIRCLGLIFLNLGRWKGKHFFFKITHQIFPSSFLGICGSKEWILDSRILKDLEDLVFNITISCQWPSLFIQFESIYCILSLCPIYWREPFWEPFNWLALLNTWILDNLFWAWGWKVIIDILFIYDNKIIGLFVFLTLAISTTGLFESLSGGNLLVVDDLALTCKFIKRSLLILLSGFMLLATSIAWRTNFLSVVGFFGYTSLRIILPWLFDITFGPPKGI